MVELTDRENYEQICYRLILLYDNRKINGEDPITYRFFGSKPEEIKIVLPLFTADMMESLFMNQPFRPTYDPHLDADYLQYHETAKAEMDALQRVGETPKARRVRMPSPETDWEIVHKAAQGTPSTSLSLLNNEVLIIVLVDHDRLPTPGQTEAARALKRRSSHQPATSSRPPPPELNRRSTVIHKIEKEERKVNGPRSPMPKTPALPQGHEHAHTRRDRDHARQGNYTTPLRSPQPMRSPQTPASNWHEYEHTPRAPAHTGGLAVPTADVVKWAANVPLPNTPLTGGFTRFTNPHGNGVNVPSSTYRPPPPRTDYGPPSSPRSQKPAPSPNRTPRKRASAVVDQAFLDDIQRLAEINSELDTPPFSKLHSSTRRNLDRLSTSISQSGLPRRRDASPVKGKMGNVFRLMNKENVPHTGGEPVLRRKRSVFGGREKEKDKEKDKENKRESTYATVSSGAERERERKSVYGTFDEPLDTQFKNVPGGLSDGNRRARREYSSYLLHFYPVHLGTTRPLYNDSVIPVRS
jgi:hypothetical protein